MSFGNFSLSNNERICGEILSLPIYPQLEMEKVDYVVSKIVEFYQ